MTVADRAVGPVPETPFREGVANATAILSVRDLTKRFSEVVAVRDLSIDFYAGEVHAILGENGAGKSTFVKMLYGFYRPTAGEILVRGQRAMFHSPADARRQGIGMVFQNFTLVPAMTVWENVALVNPASFILDAAAFIARINELSARYGLDVHAQSRVRDLSIGEQQRVEILKALAATPSILILDEPTSVLTPHEAERLLQIVRRLRDDGFAVILITHKLREVFACADRVTTLRRGEITGTEPIADLDQRALLTLMIGERGADEEDTAGGAAPPAPAGSPGALALRGVALRGADGRAVLRGVDLDVSSGEILGIAAVAGNGQAHLGDAFLGTGDATAGTVHIGGRDATALSPAERLALGLAIIPEDPLRDGAVPEMSIEENLSVTGSPRGARSFFMHPGEVTRRALEAIREAPFPVPPLKRAIGTLSGGNVQRVVLVRELNSGCKYLIAYYPTRGLDLAATRAVRERLVRFTASGGTVLLVSEDLDELRALCDRIAVLHSGEIVGCFPRADADPMEIGRLMTGGTD